MRTNPNVKYPDEGEQSGACNATPLWMEVLITVVISPFVLVYLIGAGGKWLINKMFSHD